MLCGIHIDKIKNKCPHCRNEPFKYSQEEVLGNFLAEINREEWETLGKEQIHKCKITGCQFEGNYVSMLKHRKKSHSKLTIEDVMNGEAVSNETKKADMMRNMIRRLIAFKVMELSLSAIQNMLQPDDPSEKKKHPNFEQARHMAEHVATCTSEECRKLWNTKWGTYIGRVVALGDNFCFSDCPTGRMLNNQLGWKYDDPRH